MSYYTVPQFMQAAQAQRAQLQGMLQQVQQARAAHQQSIAQVQQQYAQAANDLAAALVPDLTPEANERAVTLTGYVPWRQASPVAAARAEYDDLTRRIAAIDADPRYRDRELLRHPHTGSLTRARTELLDLKKPWDDVLARAEHPRLQRLLDAGYGTPQYGVGWWRVSYYQDWSAADEILARFPGKSFPDVAAEVARARETVATLGGELARTDAEIAAGEALERDHAALVAQRDQVGARHLTEARRRVVEHALGSDPQVLGALMAREPDTLNLYKRALGGAHKVGYLDAVYQEHVTKLEPQLIAGIARIDRDIVKYSRPKNAGARFEPGWFQQRFRDRSQSYQKHWARYGRTYQTIYVYDRYDRVDLLTDLLWWDVMTGGRYPGLYVPEVSGFYAGHPGYEYVAPERDVDLDADLSGHAAAADLGARDAADDAGGANVDAS